ncbi:putative FBD-associated F-box protein At3g50710, partial [Brachypodium distachyon]
LLSLPEAPKQTLAVPGAVELGPCRYTPERWRTASAAPSTEGREYAGVDRISDLPDGILGDIVSLLPTAEGARTQILKRRWRHIWRCSAPLNLDCCTLVARGGGREAEDELVGLIPSILSSHQGTGRRFHVPSSRHSDRAATIEAWLQSAALDNLQELDLWCTHTYLYDYVPLPPAVFRFSATVRVVTIANCNLRDSAVQGLQFPQLKQLGFKDIIIMEDSLHHMIAACPDLECLMIERSLGFACVRINSLSLRSIGVSTDHPHPHELQFVELVIDNAPCLKRLLHLEMCYHLDMHITVISAPKLETLSCCSSVSRSSTKLSFGSAAIQGLHIDSLTTVVRTVQILAVEMHSLCLDTIIDFMKCFPCLQKLYIKSFVSGNNWWQRKHRNVIKSLDIRLKTIALESYGGNQSDINFVTFFVLNARVLELMTFDVCSEHYTVEFLAEQYRKLQLDKRASRAARFHFTSNRCVRGIPYIGRAGDLDLTDPFRF